MGRAYVGVKISEYPPPLGSQDCCVAFPFSAMGLSAVCDCDTHLLLLGVIHANSDGFGESAHLLGLV